MRIEVQTDGNCYSFTRIRRLILSTVAAFRHTVVVSASEVERRRQPDDENR